ncbi:MAG: dihydrolipoyl dehydrogenase [Planctomycetes bacterium]|nr:dihydrolipoyl dehydrogenase [Planctomycetota bacterium]
MNTTACVIGAGPAGYVAAIRLAQLGVPVTLVERDARLGGTCLNVGCIPSKAYISAAKLWAELGHAEEAGISVQGRSLDLAKMKAWKDSIVLRLTTGIAGLMKNNKVQVLGGSAQFTGKNSISITSGTGSVTLTAQHFVIATGSRSMDIPPFPVNEQDVLSSTGALDLVAVPKSLGIIGGGVIGLEIGMYLMKFGTKVTVVELMDQILPGTDADCVKVLSRRLKKEGAVVHLKSKALGFTRSATGLELAIETPTGAKSALVEKILVAVGRKPNSAGLGLETAGVKLDARGFIEVDAQRRTSNPAVFAIGDVAGPPLLAHKGSKEGTLVADVIAGKNSTWDVRAMPWAIFTDPEIASVGMTETQAQAAGHTVRIGTFPFAASGRALAARETEGLVKLIADATTDRLLGAHICGPHASELIAEAALAIEAGLSAEDLALTVHTHPTLAETMMEAAEDVHNLAVHIYNPPKPGTAQA